MEIKTLSSVFATKLTKNNLNKKNAQNADNYKLETSALNNRVSSTFIKAKDQDVKDVEKAVFEAMDSDVRNVEDAIRLASKLTINIKDKPEESLMAQANQNGESVENLLK